MERISGNNGIDEKYVVLAKNGKVALGLYLKARPDYNRDGAPFTLTGRLRAASAPGCEATAQEVNDAFKALPFEKFAEDEQVSPRASMTVGIFTSQQVLEGVPGAIDALAIGPRVFNFLTKSIPVELLTVTADEIAEILKGEITAQGEKDSSVFELAKKIGTVDVAFSKSVTSLEAIQSESVAKARAAYEEALKVASLISNEAAKVLVAQHVANNPTFSFFVAEDEDHEFNLVSYLYGSWVDDDEDAAYDA